MKISPFRYQDFREAFPDLDEAQKVRLYAVFGGTPQYFLLAKQYERDIFKAIEELILTKGRELEDEPERFLEYERVRTRAKYNAIFQAIAQGKATFKEIAEYSKITPTTIPAYLQRMDSLLDLIAKRDPVLGKERLGRYTLKDPFFTFWYRFVFPHKGALHYGNTAQVLESIKENLNAHTGVIFEGIAKEILITYNGKSIQGVPIRFDDIGSWWDRNGHEIDIVANDSKTRALIIGEVKWTNDKMDTQIIDDLLEKVRYLQFNGTFKIMLVSKSGFTKQCLERVKQMDGIALDLDDVAKLLKKKI